jgi:hypothetical protein
MRFSGIWQSILSDIRYAGRTLRKSPAFVAVAVLSIALGVGANTAIFTLVDQVLLRQLPVTRPHELVLLTVRGTQYGSGWGDGNELSYPMYEDFRGHNDVFSGMFCRFGIALSLNADGRTERVASELVSGTYFPTLGVTGSRGRVIEPGDDTVANPEPVVVLSHAYWTSRFAADPAVVGKTLLVNNNRLTVIGVAQPAFHGTNLGNATQVFVPIRLAPSVTGGPLTTALQDRRMRWLNVFGRLRPYADTGASGAAAVLLVAIGDEARELRSPGRPRQSDRSSCRHALVSPPAKASGSAAPVDDAVGADGHRRHGAADRVRECRQPPAGAGDDAPARDRHPAGDWREPRRIVQQLLIESVLLALIGARGTRVCGLGSRLLLGFSQCRPDPHRVDVAGRPRPRFTLGVSAVTGVLFGRHGMAAPHRRSRRPAE